jgi:flagellar protein FlbD
MIQLTRLNRQRFFLNPEIIESIEETPDTVITLIGGKTVMVADSIGKVVHRIWRYRQMIHARRGRPVKRIAKASSVDLKT